MIDAIREFNSAAEVIATLGVVLRALRTPTSILRRSRGARWGGQPGES
jgi:hypothetical protein